MRDAEERAVRSATGQRAVHADARVADANVDAVIANDGVESIAQLVDDDASLEVDEGESEAFHDGICERRGVPLRAARAVLDRDGELGDGEFAPGAVRHRAHHHEGLGAGLEARGEEIFVLAHWVARSVAHLLVHAKRGNHLAAANYHAVPGERARVILGVEREDVDGTERRR